MVSENVEEIVMLEEHIDQRQEPTDERRLDVRGKRRLDSADCH
jgi:hypothetical protein